MRTTLGVLVAASALLLLSAEVRAQATRTWVSGVGDDVNPCSRTAPCKTFPGAISKTAAGGEIDVLDPGSYGPVVITKAITIDGGGGQIASISASASNAILVNAGASDVVIIRNLRLNGFRQTTSSPGLSGISLIAGKALYVEHCAIDGFSVSGINVVLTADGSSLFVSDTSIANSGGAGIYVSTTTGVASASIERSCLDDSAYGLIGSDNSRVTIGESFLSGNATDGIEAGTTAAITEINVARCVVANNGTGVLSNSGQTVRLSDTMVSGNTTGLSGAGAIVSFGNNQIVGNGTNGAPSSTVSQQ